jgi:uncharacterized repeat protein (TIGR01451 family)
MRLFRAISVLAILVAAFVPARASAAPSGGKSADLSITMTDAPDPVVIRWNVTYTATARNLGPDEASSVKVKLMLGSDMNFVSGGASQGTWQYTGGTLTANLGTIPSGGRATVTLVGQVHRMVRISIRGTVSSPTQDPVSNNNEWTEWTAVIEGPPPPTPGPTPSGGVFTGGGGTASGPSGAAVVTLLLMVVAGLVAVRSRFARR